MILFSPKAYAAETGGAGLVRTSGGWLNVRSEPSTGAVAIGALPNGNYVTLLGQSGSWWRVEYAKGKYGYCHADYIQKLSTHAAVVNTSGGSLNVRSGMGTSYPRIAGLHKGETVQVLSKSGGWSRVLFHGIKTGYVSSQYLSSGTGAVSLSVPSYKQNDGRWANAAIGTSGKTMAQIGCATTAIAMMESYRTGSAVYPNVMASRLRYTADGSVYWPGHFTSVTDSTDYLRGIYALLKVGKPVLLGAKNSYGKQHWVVITGFTGGSLRADRFTVHDPGSASRTTLQHFLNAYPYFYKYFHY